MSTAGIRLRAIEPEDLDFIYDIENDESLWNIGNANVPYSRYHIRQYIQDTAYDIYKDGQVHLIIETNDGTPVGVVDISNFLPHHHRAEVGIVVLSQYRGKGIGTETLSLLQRYAASTLHLNQLYAIVADDNCHAQRLFLKSGFNTTNILKKWLFDGQTYKDAVMMQFFFQKTC